MKIFNSLRNRTNITTWSGETEAHPKTNFLSRSWSRNGIFSEGWDQKNEELYNVFLPEGNNVFNRANDAKNN